MMAVREGGRQPLHHPRADELLERASSKALAGWGQAKQSLPEAQIPRSLALEENAYGFDAEEDPQTRPERKKNPVSERSSFARESIYSAEYSSRNHTFRRIPSTEQSSENIPKLSAH
jgi:hypothetical protein